MAMIFYAIFFAKKKKKKEDSLFFANNKNFEGNCNLTNFHSSILKIFLEIEQCLGVNTNIRNTGRKIV